MRFLLLFLFASILFTVIVYFRLIKKLVKRKSLRILWLIFTASLSLSFEFALKIPNRLGPDNSLYDAAVFGYYIMAIALCLLGIVLLRDIVLSVFCAKKAIKKHQCKSLKVGSDEKIKLSQQIDKLESRREFMNHIGTWAVLGATAICAPTIVYQTKHRRAVRTTELAFDNLPVQFDGLRIVHLSDIHAGNTISLSNIEEIVRQTNALTPDIIVITGDIGDGIPEKVSRILEPMRGLKSTYGVFYVTGNHEHGWDGKGWVKAVTQLGIRFLDNEHQYIEKDGARIAICGAIDYRGDRRVPGWKSDPAKALHDIPANVFKLMLVHQPYSIEISFENGADLVLAGHTHGGQFWPACYIVDAMYKYARGLYKNGNRYAFVSCGTGYWGPAFRFGVPPEIGLHILHSRQASIQTQNQHALSNTHTEINPVQNNLQPEPSTNETQIPDLTQIDNDIEENRTLTGLERKHYCLSLKDNPKKEACCAALSLETTYSCDKKLACEGSTGVFLRKCCRNLAPQSAGQRECCARLETEYPPLKCDDPQSNQFKPVPNPQFDDNRSYKGRDRSLNIYRDLVN